MSNAHNFSNTLAETWSSFVRSTGSSRRTRWSAFAWPHTRCTWKSRWKMIRISSRCVTSGNTSNVLQHLFHRKLFIIKQQNYTTYYIVEANIQNLYLLYPISIYICTKYSIGNVLMHNLKYNSANKNVYRITINLCLTLQKIYDCYKTVINIYIHIPIYILCLKVPTYL